jgi:hypothetical protein
LAVFFVCDAVAILVFAFCILLFTFVVFAFCFLLASAISYRASCVAPVRGGTYFSLPRQRKVGKRKPLQTSGAGQDNSTAHVL